MSGINEHNYEAFLLDSIEGRLSAEQQLELDTFMALHPELALDLEGLADLSFDPQQAVFPDKAALKKTGTDLVSGDQFIAYIEQQLSPEERLHVEQSCAANPELAKELALYQQTIAEADTTVVFEDKESLKRSAKIILFNFRAASFAAAASVAILLLLYVLWPATTAESLSNGYAFGDLRKAAGKGSSNTNSQDTGSQPAMQHSGSPAGNPAHQHPVIKQEAPEKLIAQQQQNDNKGTSTHSASTSPDTTSGLAHTPEKLKAQTPPEPKEPVLLASSTRKTVVDVITENDGEETADSQKKQGFWAMAGKTLKGLNKAGMKTVDGKEENNRDNASYALTLGGLNITHKSH